MIWKIWLQKSPPKSSKRPQFSGKIIRKYVYEPLAVKKLGTDKAAEGILLFKLDKLNPKNLSGKRQYNMHQFLDSIGIECLKEHITKFITIGETSDNKTQFNNNFDKVFGLEDPQGDLFEINYPADNPQMGELTKDIHEDISNDNYETTLEKVAFSTQKK